MALFRASCSLTFFLIFIFLAVETSSVDNDSLLPGQSLSGNQTLVSNGGKFELGFFSPGGSHNFYVGIWYKLPKQRVVWVANRDKPVSEPSSSRLTLTRDGGLVLLADSSATSTSIWSSALSNNSSSSSAAAAAAAVLRDDGNLVVIDGLASGAVLWQSFDHPTHAYLPGAKLGYDKRAGLNRFLACWRNSEDPSPGRYTFEIDPTGVTQFYLLRDRRRRYWTTGVWTGEMFSAVPEMRSGYFINFTNVSNAEVNEFSYHVHDPRAIHNFMLDSDGLMLRLKWDDTTQDWVRFGALPRDPCDVDDRCGPFGVCNIFSSDICQCLPGFSPWRPEEWGLGDHSGGCNRSTPPRCGERGDGFLAYSSNAQPPVKPENLHYDFSLGSEKDCQIACSRNCSCTAYEYSGQSNCSIWHGDLFNLKADKSGGNVLNVRVDASESADGSHRRSTLTRTIVLCVVLGVLVAIIVVLLLALWRRKRRASVEASELAKGSGLVAFDYRVLRKATKGFSQKLGQGSFGAVFKGELPDGSPVAVKQLQSMRQGEKQFRMEVSTIGMIHHVNLVRLLGFCCQGGRRLLVYDYMPLGSLDSVLFGSRTGSGGDRVLDWKERCQIAVGVARGLAYLHESCRECIMHCDIKPENILLDAELCPKIADFGMAKLLGREFSRVLTTFRGTFGYLAPEWITGLAITPKADVYSFGLVLLEIVSGRRNTDRCEEWDRIYFPLWVATKLHEGVSVISLLDSRLKVAAAEDEEEIRRVCKVALWCIQDLESSRPTMGEVVQQLEGVLEVGMPPIPGLLQKVVVLDVLDEDIYSSTS